MKNCGEISRCRKISEELIRKQLICDEKRCDVMKSFRGEF